MEILVPGLLLVAFMVWASTRIKKRASEAFDEETIETEMFSIKKPEGYLHVLNDSSGKAFRAYSRESATVGGKDMRQATIEIDVHRDYAIDDLVKTIEQKSDSIVEQNSYIDAGEKAVSLTALRTEGDAELQEQFKIVTRGQDVIEARTAILTDNLDDHSGKLEAMLDHLYIK